MTDLGKAVVVPQMCPKHQAIVVHGLGIDESGPWRAAIVVIQILLFQAATATETVKQRWSGGTMADLTLVLAELGCLACFQPEQFNRAMGMAARHGLNHCAQVSQGKLIDPDWPLSQELRT